MSLKPVDPNNPPNRPTPREILRDLSNHSVKGIVLSCKMSDGAWSTIITDLTLEEVSYALSQMEVIHHQRISLSLHQQANIPPSPPEVPSENPAS